jgi:hypothetical protein
MCIGENGTESDLPSQIAGARGFEVLPFRHGIGRHRIDARRRCLADVADRRADDGIPRDGETAIEGPRVPETLLADAGGVTDAIIPPYAAAASFASIGRAVAVTLESSRP